MQRHEESYVPELFGSSAVNSRGDQPGLFDPPQRLAVDDAPTRRSDSPTSRLAAAKEVASGRISIRNQKILTFLSGQRGDYTYREIGRAIDEDCVEVMRRLNTLRKKNLVEKYGCRKCSTNGNEMTTWRAKR